MHTNWSFDRANARFRERNAERFLRFYGFAPIRAAGVTRAELFAGLLRGLR